MPWANELGTSDRWSWVHARGELSLDRAGVMAILNLTPDSFSDGGRFAGPPEVARRRVLETAADFVRAGADVLDVGGESTRPGAAPVSAQEEQARVLATVRSLAVLDCPVSIDTRNASTAAEAMAAGAAIINDVTGLEDPAMADVAAASGAGLVIGHLRGVPATMQNRIAFADVLSDVAAELSRSVDRAVEAGVARERILVDPGIGFGKTAEQSAALVAASVRLRAETGCHVLIGASRKSFLATLGAPQAGDRFVASIAAALTAVEAGASIVRVHDVAATAVALRVRGGIRGAAIRMTAVPNERNVC